jgi:hypothetical protein
MSVVDKEGERDNGLLHLMLSCCAIQVVMKKSKWNQSKQLNQQTNKEIQKKRKRERERER